jgi:hypothetical protein
MPLSHINIQFLKNWVPQAWKKNRPRFDIHPKVVITRICRKSLLKWSNNGVNTKKVISLLNYIITYNYNCGCKILYLIFEWTQPSNSKTSTLFEDQILEAPDFLKSFEIVKKITQYYTTSMECRLQIPLDRALFIHGCVDLAKCNDFSDLSKETGYVTNDHSLFIKSSMSANGSFHLNVSDMTILNPFLKKLGDSKVAAMHFLHLHRYEDVLIADESPSTILPENYAIPKEAADDDDDDDDDDDKHLTNSAGTDIMSDLFLMILAMESSHRKFSIKSFSNIGNSIVFQKNTQEIENDLQNLTPKTRSKDILLKKLKECFVENYHYEYNNRIYFANFKMNINDSDIEKEMENQTYLPKNVLYATMKDEYYSVINIIEDNIVDFEILWKSIFYKISQERSNGKYLHINSDICLNLVFVLSMTSLNSFAILPKKASTKPFTTMVYDSDAIYRMENSKRTKITGIKRKRDYPRQSKARDRTLFYYLSNLDKYKNLCQSHTFSTNPLFYSLPKTNDPIVNEIFHHFHNELPLGLDINFNENLLKDLIKNSKFNSGDNDRNMHRITLYCRQLEWSLIYLVNSYRNTELIPNPVTKYNGQSFFGWCMDENGECISEKNVCSDNIEIPLSLILLPTILDN